VWAGKAGVAPSPFQKNNRHNTGTAVLQVTQHIKINRHHKKKKKKKKKDA